MPLNFVQSAGHIIEPEHRANPADGILNVLQFQQLSQILDHFAVLVCQTQLDFQEVLPPCAHRVLRLSLSDGEVQVMAESVEEGLGAELGEEGLDVHVVGAPPFDLGAVVSQPEDQVPSVLRTAEGLVVGVQHADVSAVSAERMHHVGATWRG